MKLSKNQLKELVNEAYGEVIIEQIGLEQAREIALIGEIALTLGLDIQSRSKAIKKLNEDAFKKSNNISKKIMQEALQNGILLNEKVASIN